MKTNKKTMTEAQRQAKRDRDARYRAAKKARAMKTCEKADKKPTDAKKPAKKPAGSKREDAGVLEISIGGVQIPSSLSPIFRGFMSTCAGVIGAELARVLNAFEAAVLANGSKVESSSATVVRKCAKKPAKKVRK